MNENTIRTSDSRSTPSFEAYGGSAPENYERYFVPAIGMPLATELTELAELRSGERVLDIACGTGVVAKLAAERVAPTGTVAGTDINPGMLSVARSTTPPRTAIDWYEASADSLPSDDSSFDVALCQLGLQFFPDRPAALREMWRVLAPGGRVAVSVPGPTPRIFQIMEEALAHHLNADVAAFVHVVFSLHDAREMTEFMTDAGFRDVQGRAHTKMLWLPAPETFLWQYVHSTPLAAAVAQLGGEDRAALARDVATQWQPFTRDGGLVLEQGVTVATGVK
jgi:ubiquinone/menaquinone biosynthesis C-methylase UbiE